MDVSNYLDLVPTENYNKPKFMSFLEAVLDPVMSLQDVVSMPEAFNVDIAAGSQLDVLGECVGVQRELDHVPANGDVSMTDDEYRAVMKMRLAQSIWDGSNEDAAETYKNVLGDLAQVTYVEAGNCNVEVDIIGSSSARVSEIMNEFSAWLIPAGVGLLTAIIGSDIPISTKAGTAISGETIVDTVNIVDDGESYLVEDIEDMYVEYLQCFPVRRWQK